MRQFYQIGFGCDSLVPLPPLRLQLQQQVAQLGALARKARLGSLAHPPPLADFLGARAHVVVPVHHLLEQLGGHARIARALWAWPVDSSNSMPNHIAASPNETRPWLPTSMIEV